MLLGGKRNGLRRRLLGAAGLVAVGRFCNGILLALLSAILTRMLTKEMMGYYQIIITLPVLIGQVLSLGMPDYCTREIARVGPIAERHLLGRRLLLMGLSTITFLTVVSCLLMVALQETLPLSLQLSLLVMVWLALRAVQLVLAGVLYGLQRFGPTLLLTGLPEALLVLFLLAVWSLDSGGPPATSLPLDRLLLFMLSGALLACLLGGWLLLRGLSPLKASDNAFSLQELLRDTVDSWRQGLALLGGTFSTSTMLNMDVWFAGWLLGPAAAAEYGLARRIELLARLPQAITGTVLAPFLSELHAGGEYVRLRRVVGGLAGLNTMLALTVVVFLWLVGPQVVRWAFGDEYSATAYLAGLLCLGVMLQSVFGPGARLLQMAGYQSIVLRIGAFSVVVLAVLQYGGATLADLQGLAWATVIGLSLVQAIFMLLARQRTRVWTWAYLQLLQR